MSFRDLASDLGIKSSSVHYYFRHKEDLAVALVDRYSEKFFSRLQTQNNGKPNIATLCAMYRAAFTTQGHICLCGILGAEKNGLPEKVSQAVTQFLSKNVNWAIEHLPENTPEHIRQRKAEHIVATLQGALILTKNLSGIDVFDRIADDLLSSI